MKFPTIRFLSDLAVVAFVTLSAVVVNGAGDHDTCACAAKEEGFAIDCGNQGAMTAALTALTANDCEADCSSEVCHRNYLIMQSHHDYCLESELPSTLEDALHVYEDTCEECEITKKYDSSLPDCPAASCTDDSGNTAWTNLVGNDCGTDCSSTVCGDSFQTLKVVHDTCPEDALSTAAEANYHDIEGSCNALHGCNLPVDDSGADPLVCESSVAAVPVSLSRSAAGLVTAVLLTMIY